MIAVIMPSARINTPFYMPTVGDPAATSPLVTGIAGTQKPPFGGNFGLAVGIIEAALAELAVRLLEGGACGASGRPLGAALPG
jgi:hypothetical protein